jgi:flagellar hook-associated protein 2
MPSVSFGGIGSGLDVEAIINGLSAASRSGLSSLKSKSASVKAAVSTISDIGSLLGKLKSATEALDTERETGSYKASSSSKAVVASANGGALPGRYSIQVNELAAEQRTYSNPQASQDSALGMSFNLGIKVGTGTEQFVQIDNTDSLTSIAGKINALGSRVSAAVVFTGDEYRLQVRGLDTGEDNAVAFTAGDPLGLSTPANTVQQAKDAEIEVDGFTIKRPTNQVQSVIPGVTLALTETTTSPVSVAVEGDPEGLKTKLRDFISAYNSVVERVQSETGFASKKASNPVLAGDSTLRMVTGRLSNMVTSRVGSSEDTLASIGIRLNNNGTLRLDDTKLGSALESDPAGVIKILAGTDSQAGAMDSLRDLVATFTTAGTGLLANRSEALNGRAKSMDNQLAREEARITSQEALLRKQFNAMDQLMAANNSTIDYLSRVSGG